MNSSREVEYYIVNVPDDNHSQSGTTPSSSDDEFPLGVNYGAVREVHHAPDPAGRVTVYVSTAKAFTDLNQGVREEEYSLSPEIWKDYPRTSGRLTEPGGYNAAKVLVDVLKGAITFGIVLAFHNLIAEPLLQGKPSEQLLGGTVLTVMTDLLYTVMFMFIEKPIIHRNMLNFQHRAQVNGNLRNHAVINIRDEDDEERAILAGQASTSIPLCSKVVCSTTFPSCSAFWDGTWSTGVLVPFGAGGVGGVFIAMMLALGVDVPVIASAAITIAAVTIFFSITSRREEAKAGSAFPGVHEARLTALPSLR